MRKAIIDLGTNTFNLLVVENVDGEYKTLFADRIPVKLGQGGINNGRIKRDAVQRGFKAIEQHLATASEHMVDKVYAFGTSALRGALNREDFLDILVDKYNLDVKIITGDEEAELIYLGVRKAVPLNNETVCILDIGGGSNELILANNEKIFWKHSFNLGIARLLDRFKPSDPLRYEEMDHIISFCETQLEPFFQALKKFPTNILIGASGSFETFISMILFEKYGTDELLNSNTSLEILRDDFEDLYHMIINSTQKERKKMKGLIAFRIEMIVLATLFTHVLVEKGKFTTMLYSAYALKEGALEKIMD